jgi:hypothetical protein
LLHSLLSASLSQGKDKEEMEELTRSTFAERGVSSKRTKVGRDIIFRKGDPCSAHDLVRVAAHVRIRLPTPDALTLD